MAATILTQQFTLDTSGSGTQTFTISGAGTCKGYLLYFSRATTNGTEAATACQCIGFVGTDGTTRSVSVQAEDAQSRADTRSYQSTTDFKLFNATQSGLDCEMSHNSFTTDGFILNMNNYPASAYLMTAVIFYGADINIEVGTLTTSATDATEVTVTTNQTSDLALWIRDASGTVDAVTNNALWHVGASTNDGGITQRAFRILDRDNSNTTDVEGAFFEAAVDMNFNGSGSVDRYYDVTTQSSTQLGITSHNNGAAGAARQFFYASINFGGVIGAAHLATWDQPTTPTGNKSYTGAPWTPQCGMIFCAGEIAAVTAVSGTTDETNPGGMVLTAFDGTRTSSVGSHSEDGVPDSDTGSTCNNSVETRDDNGAVLRAGTFSSFNSDGFTLNYSTLPGTAHKAILVLFEEETVTVGPTLRDRIHPAVRANVTR